MRDWKSLHHSFERLWSTYRQAHSNEEIGLQVLRHAMNPDRYSISDIEREARGFQLEVDLDHDWREIATLRDVFEPLSELGFSSHTPAESVYQTAIQVRLQRIEDAANHDGDARWFYRGQRNHCWETVPKIMRDLRNQSAADTLFEERVQKVRKIVARMKLAGLAKDDFEATAIVQHYSSELEIATWLLDVTASPWVALFFASDGGNTGEIGKLEYLEFDEWMLFSGGGENALGAIRATSPASVLRIRNQEGFFLQAPHPDLLSELSVRILCFRQEDGVVFQSEAFDPPLTRDLVYPADDPTLAALRRLPPDSLEANKLQWEPTAAVLRAPDRESYLPVARAVLEEETNRRPDSRQEAEAFDWEETLRELCGLHAVVCSHRSELPRYVTTLHHLRRLVSYMLVNAELGISTFLNFCYLQHCRNDTAAQNAFRRCLHEASSFWKRAMEEEMPESQD